MKQQTRQQTKTKRPIKLPRGFCGNPQCKHEWLVRVEKPVKCPRCGSINIWTE